MSPVSVSSVVERVARRLHRSVVLAAALWAAVAFSTVLLLAWLLAGPDGWRQGSWGPLLLDGALLAVLAGGVSLVLAVRRLWLAEPRVARCVEDAAGLNPGTVVGSLELSRALPPGVSKGLATFGERILLERLNHPDHHLAAPMRRRVAVWTRGALAGLAIFAPALVLAGTMSPERSMAAWSGLSTPVVLLAPPVLPPIEVQPGDQEVRRGEGVQVHVRAPGRGSATLHWQPAGDVRTSEPLVLDAEAAAGWAFPSITVPVRYWVTTPDGAESDVFELTPIDPLFVSDLRIVLEFPSHTGKLPEEYRGDVPPLSFPAGTRVRIDGRASRTLGEGALTKQGSEAATELTIAGRAFTASWVPRESGVYEWRFTGEDGAPAELLPRPLEVTLLGDAAPEVWFTFPAVDTLMPMTLQQPLVLEVRDDYAVTVVDLVAYRVTSAGESQEPVTQRIEVGGVQHAIARPLLDMTGWGLLPGDEVRYLARATDNSPSGQTVSTREWVLRMPEAAELRRGAQEALELAADQIEQLATQAERAAEETRNLERQAAGERTGQGGRGRAGGASQQESAGFQQREDVRQAMERQENLSSQLDSIRSQLEALSEAMREAGVRDPGLRQDLEELQQLMNEVSTPEMRDQLQQMQQNLEGMDARQAQEMLRDLGQMQEQLRQQLEESLERFRRAAVEQDFRATTSEAEELARLERALSEAMREGGNSELRAQQQQDLQRRAEDVQQNMQTLEQRLEQLGEEQAARGVEQSRQQTDAARQAMQQAERQTRSGQNQQAAQQAQQAAAAMEQAASDLREAGREMADERSEATRQALQGAAEDALGLARRQSEIREQMRGADAQQMQSLRGDVGAVLQGLRSMTENVNQAMQQSGGPDREVSERTQQATEALERTIEAMGQRPGGNPAPGNAAENAVDALNQLALSALAGARQAEQQGQGQGQGQQQQGDLMQQMEGLAQQQGQLNNQAGQLAPMQLGQQAMQQQLEDLARAQESVAGELGRMAGQPQSEQMLGDLRALQEEARQLAELLQGGRLDPETRRRQERLFHRLLDAGRTLEQEDEMSDEREARRPGAVETRNVLPLSAEAVGAIRFRLPDAATLQQMGPAQRQLVIQYFERLNRETPVPEPPSGSTGTPAGAPPPSGGR